MPHLLLQARAGRRHDQGFHAPVVVGAAALDVTVRFELVDDSRHVRGVATQGRREVAHGQRLVVGKGLERKHLLRGQVEFSGDALDVRLADLDQVP